MNKEYLTAQAGKRKQVKYPFVKIGNQYWTTKNFAETSTVLGTPITNVTNNTIWASSQTLYTNKYNERIGLGDTVEQATYAAIKVSAFWCDYNNDPVIGLIYGHLYNWFSVKLIQMDIDYYNAQLLATYGNTPEYYTRRYVWKIPLAQNFNDLSTALGGNSVSGGKLKKEGTVNWGTTQPQVDNIYGFSAIGSGHRNIDGSFMNMRARCRIWTINDSDITAKARFIDQFQIDFIESNLNKIEGQTIRQIKAA